MELSEKRLMGDKFAETLHLLIGLFHLHTLMCSYIASLSKNVFHSESWRHFSNAFKLQHCYWQIWGHSDSSCVPPLLLILKSQWRALVWSFFIHCAKHLKDPLNLGTNIIHYCKIFNCSPRHHPPRFLYLKLLINYHSIGLIQFFQILIFSILLSNIPANLFISNPSTDFILDFSSSNFQELFLVFQESPFYTASYSSWFISLKILDSVNTKKNFPLLSPLFDST